MGASAGGLESLGRLLEGMPESFPAPILVALHLDPHHRSQAVPLLQRRTRLQVRTARGGLRAEAGVVYIAPPDRHLEIHAGKLRLSHGPRVNYSRPSIDRLFGSVAADYGPAGIVVILSGAGSDGSVGLAAVKARGGLAIAEDASTAKFPAMPEAAGRTGLLDAILPVDQIPAFLLRAVARRVRVAKRQWAQMLAILEAKTGAKFSRYRTTTLHRRLQHRMAATGARTMAAYLRLLGLDGGEADRLKAAFLIKVSSFLRDPPSWRALAQEIGLASPPEPPGLRVWSAGCATGEEAYTLAMVVASQLGVGPGAQWKVYATDLDEAALKVARAGWYNGHQVRGIPKATLIQHFVRDGTGWRVSKVLRSHVVFGRHDLLRDPPISGMDVLACRNVLIYFNPEERRRTVGQLCSAINANGILFLGRSEAGGPVPGFDRVGGTTFFRKAILTDSMPKRKIAPAPDDSDGPGVEAPASSPGTSPALGRRRGTRSSVAAGGASFAAVPPRLSAGETSFLAQQNLNEELQSRNEELETVNEELQSLNDEMSTMEEKMSGLGEESRRANDFLRLLLDTSPDPLIACDANNRVTFWSKAAVKRFRLSSMQAVGGELFDLVPALGVAALRAASSKVHKAGRGGRVVVKQGGFEYLFDPLPSTGAGKRRGYLLRVRTKAP